MNTREDAHQAKLRAKRAAKEQEREEARQEKVLWSHRLVAGQQDALAAKCDQTTTQSLLARLRQGDVSAKAELRKGYEWLVYEAAFKIGGQRRKYVAADLISILYEGMDGVINALVENGREDVERLIRDELWRSFQDLRCQDSQNVLVPSSTRATRKKRNQEPYSKLTKRSNAERALADVDGDGKYPEYVYERPVAGPCETQDGELRPVPSCMVNQGEALRRFELADALARTEEDRQIVDLLISEVPREDIAKRLSCSLYRVNKAIAGIAERMRQASMAPPTTSIECALNTDAPVAPVAEPLPSEELPAAENLSPYAICP